MNWLYWVLGIGAGALIIAKLTEEKETPEQLQKQIEKEPSELIGAGRRIWYNEGAAMGRTAYRQDEGAATEMDMLQAYIPKARLAKLNGCGSCQE